MVGETLLREKEVNINVYTEHYRHKRWRYHNELYEQLKSIHGENLDYKKFDNQFFIGEKGEKKDRPWKGHPNEVSINTHVRNQIHHSADNGLPSEEDIRASIERMRSYL